MFKNFSESLVYYHVEIWFWPSSILRLISSLILSLSAVSNDKSRLITNLNVNFEVNSEFKVNFEVDYEFECQNRTKVQISENFWRICRSTWFLNFITDVDGDQVWFGCVDNQCLYLCRIFILCGLRGWMTNPLLTHVWFL